MKVTPDGKGKRLDAWLSRAEPDLSRARIQELIRTGHITLNGKPAKPSQTLVPGQEIQIEIPPAVEIALQPESIPLDILYEDTDLIVINKPAGLVVHPPRGTLPAPW